MLTYNEEANIARCLESLAWCSQVLVVDSGSTDATVRLAERAGARVLSNPWPGFAAQRQWALEHPDIHHDWIYFVDADEWVSAALAREIASAIQDPNISAYEQRFRLIFQGRWIQHCGWYANAWITRLMRRSRAHFETAASFGERPAVHGLVRRLRTDIVDEDRKGLASWLHKHVRYAELEASRRANTPPLSRQIYLLLKANQSVRSRSRTVAKEIVYPLTPGKPLALFGYMYVFRRGFLDGPEGLLFCLLHAWHEFVIHLLRTEGLDRDNPVVSVTDA